jgi:hypothetical protein
MGATAVREPAVDVVAIDARNAVAATAKVQVIRAIKSRRDRDMASSVTGQTLES